MSDDLLPLLNKAYFFLKFRPRSEKEVRDYLYKKISTTHWSRDAADKVIDKLKKQGLINDAEFTDWFVRYRNNLKPKSKKILTYELRKKGINEDLIEKYFQKNDFDEFQLAQKIIQQKSFRFKNTDPKTRYQKLVSLLIRRGFSYEVAKSVYNKMFGV